MGRVPAPGSLTEAMPIAIRPAGSSTGKYSRTDTSCRMDSFVVDCVIADALREEL